ncbi:glycoside hydrolase superfamily [Massariosphaeria phaeospora]|uniref:Glycoside hydrolase superfamily n=1 Tax=Massariosphaeria phaeospora TaxID=100035 RepID=A0A7C8MI71_9PLEO|nr:glycoside hydrolase superfamily [Massariosphaeria phaeospora]
MRLNFGIITSLLATATCATSIIKRATISQANGSDYKLQDGPLDTPWTSKVGTNPWPEYPRPQLKRSQWKNLNGVWRYQRTTVDAPPFDESVSKAVLVPFCLESALSGIMEERTIYSWYKTNFDVPSDWTTGNRVLLNFGAVDYNTTVFINRQKVFNHVGGYSSFAVDVTDHLSSNGTNELRVFVHDPTDDGTTQIPIGKQTLNPSHIFYRPCSGIWQTVWLESAPKEHVTQLDVSADMNGLVNITAYSSGNASSPVEITIYEPNSEEVIATAKGSANSPFQFKVDSPQLWSPKSPTLYNITVKLGSDTIQSYTGFRTISSGEVGGIPRPLLNGEFLFQFGTLDQGWWPDGLMSPPSREAMVYDLEVLKEVGYNMIKVEPALFYQACDQLGLLVIQDMPSLRQDAPSLGDHNPACGAPRVRVNSQAAQAEFDRQLAIVIQQHKSYPSIVTWTIYNEGWGQEIDKEHPEFRLTDMVRSIDPTRLVNSVSGWDDFGAGNFHDNHHYANPQCGTPYSSRASTPYDPRRIALQGEFGGIGANVSEENLWKVPQAVNAIDQTYELHHDLGTWNYRAHLLLSELKDQVEMFACSGAVWTQTTDVEGEVNGMVTYDRRVNRMNKEQWRNDIQALYDAAAARAGNSTSQMMPRAASPDGI